MPERESNRNLKALFKREAREGLSENVTLKQRIQGREDTVNVQIWGKYIPGRGDSKGKAPEVGKSLGC